MTLSFLIVFFSRQLGKASPKIWLENAHWCNRVVRLFLCLPRHGAWRKLPGLGEVLLTFTRQILGIKLISTHNTDAVKNDKKIASFYWKSAREVLMEATCITSHPLHDSRSGVDRTHYLQQKYILIMLLIKQLQCFFLFFSFFFYSVIRGLKNVQVVFRVAVGKHREGGVVETSAEL